MKTSDKAWIFIVFFLLSMTLGYIIYDLTYSHNTIPSIYHIEQQVKIMNVGVILMFILLYIIILFLVIHRFYIEPRDFNEGYCKHCGTKLRYFDNDSSGARGYTCDNCGYTTWISYFADKNFK